MASPPGVTFAASSIFWWGGGGGVSGSQRDGEIMAEIVPQSHSQLSSPCGTKVHWCREDDQINVQVHVCKCSRFHEKQRCYIFWYDISSSSPVIESRGIIEFRVPFSFHKIHLTAPSWIDGCKNQVAASEPAAMAKLTAWDNCITGQDEKSSGNSRLDLSGNFVARHLALTQQSTLFCIVRNYKKSISWFMSNKMKQEQWIA